MRYILFAVLAIVATTNALAQEKLKHDHETSKGATEEESAPAVPADTHRGIPETSVAQTADYGGMGYDGQNVWISVELVRRLWGDDGVSKVRLGLNCKDLGCSGAECFRIRGDWGWHTPVRGDGRLLWSFPNLPSGYAVNFSVPSLKRKDLPENFWPVRHDLLHKEVWGKVGELFADNTVKGANILLP